MIATAGRDAGRFAERLEPDGTFGPLITASRCNVRQPTSGPPVLSGQSYVQIVVRGDPQSYIAATMGRDRSGMSVSCKTCRVFSTASCNVLV